MSTKPQPQPQPYHFYASSIAEWKCEENIETLFKFMKKEKLPFAVWYIPLPLESTYSIQEYAPVVEGAIFLHKGDC